MHQSNQSVKRNCRVCVFLMISPLGKTEQYTLIKFGLLSKHDMLLTFAVARARDEFISIYEILILCIFSYLFTLPKQDDR